VSLKVVSRKEQFLSSCEATDSFGDSSADASICGGIVIFQNNLTQKTIPQHISYFLPYMHIFLLSKKMERVYA